MASRIPARVLAVYMVGAGLSTAFKISNTPSLLSSLVDFSRTSDGAWLAKDSLETRLAESYKFFYPDAQNVGFRPDPVDYFSALRTFIDVGKTFQDTGFDDAEVFYKTLKRGIAHLLITQQKAYDDARLATHPYLSEMMQPGHVVITSNWDTMLERFAALNSIPLRLSTSNREFSPSEVTLLKLHGSIDWCKVGDRVSGYGDEQFANITELQNPARRWTMKLPTGTDELIRVRSGTGDGWQKIKARSKDQWMVTMVTGKADDLGPLVNIWRDAYRALSRAENLEVVGYSLPPDDVEIRSLLRAGIRRGAPPPINVRNPAPDVHYRVRAFLERSATSDYQPV